MARKKVENNIAYIQGGRKKRGHKLRDKILSNLNRFTFFSLKDSVVNLRSMVIKTTSTPCRCCHTTWRNINARKQAINDKLQSSVVT